MLFLKLTKVIFGFWKNFERKYLENNKKKKYNKKKKI